MTLIGTFSIHIMIRKDIGIGQIVITDAAFGHVGVGDETFLKRFESNFSLRPDHVVWMDQVHSPMVQWCHGIMDGMTVFPKTDGLLTDQPGLMLITKTADCVPILLWNERDGMVAALHCGWKGFMSGILEGFAQQCRDKHIPLENFSAFLGPHLRGEHFEVRQDFIDQVPETKKTFLESREGKVFYNLTKGVQTVLHAFGIQHIEDSGIDTYGNAEYFSYRHWSQQPEMSRPKDYNTFASCIIMR